MGVQDPDFPWGVPTTYDTDIDLPIALRKVKQSCVTPSYSKLVPS